MFSVIVPTFDRGALLLETLRGVANQTLQPAEVLVINNGTERVPAESLPLECRVYDVMRGCGCAQARNIGAVLAESPYLAFLDDDDLWESQYLEKAERILRSRDVDILVARLDQLVDGQVTRYKNAQGKLSLDSLFLVNPGTQGSNIIVSRASFMEIGGFDTGLATGEDKSFMIEAVIRGLNIVCEPDMQAIWRRHKGRRMTDAQCMARGVADFYRKYRHLMSFHQRARVKHKIARQRVRGSERSRAVDRLRERVWRTLVSLSAPGPSGRRG